MPLKTKIESNIGIVLIVVVAIFYLYYILFLYRQSKQSKKDQQEQCKSNVTPRKSKSIANKRRVNTFKNTMQMNLTFRDSLDSFERKKDSGNVDYNSLLNSGLFEIIVTAEKEFDDLLTPINRDTDDIIVSNPILVPSNEELLSIPLMDLNNFISPFALETYFFDNNYGTMNALCRLNLSNTKLDINSLEDIGFAFDFTLLFYLFDIIKYRHFAI
jgi:hypothetical protein